jgi:hypothetical protein
MPSRFKLKLNKNKIIIAKEKTRKELERARFYFGRTSQLFPSKRPPTTAVNLNLPLPPKLSLQHPMESSA